MAHDFSLQHHAQLRTFVAVAFLRNVLTVSLWAPPGLIPGPDGGEQFRGAWGEHAVEGQRVWPQVDPL